MPSLSEVKAVIPKHCFELSLLRSSFYTILSIVLTIGTAWAAWAFIPFTLNWLPAWILYALVCGTFATGIWVVAHECGHGAFCNNSRLQDTIGFVLHSALLVPYFSWKRSHAIHHSRTNHLHEGETFVPPQADSKYGKRLLRLHQRLGARAYAIQTLVSRLVFGWPLYLLLGTTGGPNRGTTNHFWPYRPFSKALFPQKIAGRVVGSALGVVAMITLLIGCAIAAGSLWSVLAIYLGPYLIVNAWLVGYTKLQHTGHDVPHYDANDWTFVRGAFCSIDRPYGRLIDLLHHRIGSTHVAHHLSSRIPHYRALEATNAVAAAFPQQYRYDPTPVLLALWRESKLCVAVVKTVDGWRYRSS